MKKTKKILTLMLCMSMLFAFAGCKTPDASIDNSGSNNPPSSSDGGEDSSTPLLPPVDTSKPSTITFLTGIEGVEVEPTTLSYNQEYELPTPTNEAYNFVIWQNNGKNVTQSGVWKLYGDVTLTAQWVPKSFSIIYDMGDNSQASLRSYEQEVRYNTQYVLAVPDNNDGNVSFSHWVIKGTDTKFENGIYTYTNNVELVAIWSADWTPLG